jgi:tetratricopeptide (TPR) repeat protein
MKAELYIAIAGFVVGIIGILYAILHHRALKRLQKDILNPLPKVSKLMIENKWDEAITQFKQLMKDAKGSELWKYCNQVGICYSASGQLDLALESYNLSLSLAKYLIDEKGEAHACNYLGLHFKARGEKEKALKYFKDALKIFRKIGAQRETTDIKKNIKILKGK